MTPQFMREEAARFRGMAEIQEREASKIRLLKMADDYDARAKAADAPSEPNLVEAAIAKPAKKAAGAAPPGAT